MEAINYFDMRQNVANVNILMVLCERSIIFHMRDPILSNFLAPWCYCCSFGIKKKSRAHTGLGCFGVLEWRAPVWTREALTAEIPKTELLVFSLFAPLNVWSIGISVGGRGGEGRSPERGKNWHFHSPKGGRGWMYSSPSFTHLHHLFSSPISRLSHTCRHSTSSSIANPPPPPPFTLHLYHFPLDSQEVAGSIADITAGVATAYKLWLTSLWANKSAAIFHAQ